MADKVGRSFDELMEQRSFRTDPSMSYSYQTAYDSKKGSDNKMRHAAIRGILEKSLLNQMFFSGQNIKKIQNKLRYTVFKMSREQFIIEEQNEEELVIVMRSIFLQYAKHLPYNIKEQIAELNNIVVDNIADKVLSNVKQYLVYLRDKTESYRIMDNAQSTSSAGTKSLEIHTALGFGDPDYKPFK